MKTQIRYCKMKVCKTVRSSDLITRIYQMISFYLLMVGKKDGFLVEVVGRDVVVRGIDNVVEVVDDVPVVVRGVVVVMSGILGTL